MSFLQETALKFWKLANFLFTLSASNHPL